MTGDGAGAQVAVVEAEQRLDPEIGKRMTDHAAPGGREKLHGLRAAAEAGSLARILSLVMAVLGLPLLSANAGEAPTVTANFHTIGLYWSRPQNPAGVAIQYRQGRHAAVWKGAQPLWWDSALVNP